MVETRAEVDRVLAGSRIPLCLDTGHLLIGGTDPLELTRQVPDRIEHAHLKDVNVELAAKVQSGELTYTQAVAAGMYVPLGAGDVDIAGIVKTLEDNGYDGWYVMEQDNILDGEPEGRGSAGRRAGQRGVPAGRGAGRVVVTLRIGVLGASRIAELAIVGPAPDLGHRLVAVAARDPHRAALFAEKYGVERVLGLLRRRARQIPRSISSTTRWRTHCTGRGTSPRCGPASRCWPKSRTPATPTRRAKWPRPHRPRVCRWWRRSTTAITR